MSGIPSWAKVGAKVICVDDFTPPSHPMGLVRGEVYTINGLDHASAGFGPYAGPIHPVAILAELDNPWAIGFALARFRPVKTIEDDISEHFAQHLTVRAPLPVEMAS